MGEAAQDLREIGGTDFGGSASTGGKIGKAADFFAGHAGRVAQVLREAR